MEIKPIEYLVWAKTKPKSGINLSLSGLMGLSREELAVDWDDLEINGDHPYGHPPLLEAIAARHRTHVDNVCPVVGASQGIFSVCAALLGPGDEVLVERPAYEPFLAVPRLFGANVTRFERRFENGYRIDLEEFRRAFTPRTKLVLLANPHNPSGVALSHEEILALALASEEKGAAVLIDEIYLEFLEGERAGTAFGLAPNIVVTSSLTKVFGLAGLRCGWILAQAGLAVVLRRLMDYMIVEQVFIGEQVAARMFVRLDEIRWRSRPLIEGNLRIVSGFMRDQEILEWVAPDPGIICFPRFRGARDATELARCLLDGFDTGIVPGRFFEEPRSFRLGFGIPTESLVRGLANLKRALTEQG
jgi:aspartate/methionine/tyrosine aminotransferase